jgi:RNA-directed DNA polymerase
MPHKIKNLWPQIADYDSLLYAWKEVRQRKATKPVILRFESNLAVNLSRLEHSLLDGSYHPRKHFEFWINDPKARLIQAPCLEDRIIQHAVCNALRFPIQQRLIAQTYSCLIGRGTHRCSEQFLSYLDDTRWRYALKLDISKFFYSIDHDALMLELHRHVDCRKTLNLLQQFIKSNGSSVGIPIGASTSQILANLALNPLDHFARRDLKLGTYLRYCDDMIALFETAKEANEAMDAMRGKAAELKLSLNSKSGVHYVADGVDWVGYRHWRGKRLIRKRALKRLRRKAPGCGLETAMAYLSHAKGTASIACVANTLWVLAPEHRCRIHAWIGEHAPHYYPVLQE